MSDVSFTSNFDVNLERDNKIFASFFHRIAALCIDGLVIFLFLLLNFYNTLIQKNLFLHLFIFGFMFLLKVGMEIRMKTSLGKWIFKIQLINEVHKPLETIYIIKRNLLFLCSIFFTFIQGLIFFTSHEEVSLQLIPWSNGFSVETLITLALFAVHFMFLISFLCILITPKKQSLCDLFADCFCVYKNYKDYLES